MVAQVHIPGPLSALRTEPQEHPALRQEGSLDPSIALRLLLSPMPPRQDPWPYTAGGEWPGAKALTLPLPRCGKLALLLFPAANVSTKATPLHIPSHCCFLQTDIDRWGLCSLLPTQVSKRTPQNDALWPPGWTAGSRLASSWSHLGSEELTGSLA